VCGLAYLARHVVRQLEAHLGANVYIDIAEIVKGDLKPDFDSWPDKKVVY
jgi:hypothetical protein